MIYFFSDCSGTETLAQRQIFGGNLFTIRQMFLNVYYQGFPQREYLLELRETIFVVSLYSQRKKWKSAPTFLLRILCFTLEFVFLLCTLSANEFHSHEQAWSLGYLYLQLVTPAGVEKHGLQSISLYFAIFLAGTLIYTSFICHKNLVNFCAERTEHAF